MRVPRMRVKPGIVAHLCNPRIPMARWEMEAGEFLEACEPGRRSSNPLKDRLGLVRQLRG